MFDALAQFKSLPYFMAMPGAKDSKSLVLRSEHAQSARELIVADLPVVFKHSTTADLRELISKKFESSYVAILDDPGNFFF